MLLFYLKRMCRITNYWYRENLVASGDKINKIQAVLSGSLNFIFNNFDQNSTFHDVVKEAGIQDLQSQIRKLIWAELTLLERF
jgi:hypothetical protein